MARVDRESVGIAAGKRLGDVFVGFCKAALAGFVPGY
jgi:hypothetical protein